MLISTKGRYALRALVDMAEHENGEYMPLRDVARRQDISEKYMESVVKLLVRGGILTGVRGKGGGYRLRRPPDQISVGEVLRLCEGTLSPVSCLGPDATPCERAAHCGTLPLWRGLDRVISDYLDRYTLADLTRSHDGGNDYVI
ncbi:MAG: Rrf2 family transcriptional regulator [Oscillospiraceae bacterium]|nr:Rrf2 family transcriptional regulator [Oscillospiraceae bacterium]